MNADVLVYYSSKEVTSKKQINIEKQVVVPNMSKESAEQFSDVIYHIYNKLHVQGNL